MSTDDNLYCLRIVSAAKLPLAARKKPPNASVKIRLGTSKYETKVIKRNREPTWNEEFRFIGPNVTSMLSLSMRHKWPFFGFKTTMSSKKITIGQLLDECKNTKEVELDLISHRGRRVSLDGGRIRLLLLTPTAASTAAFAIAESREAKLGSTARQYIGDATAAISAQNDTLKALGAVLSKLDLFVKIVDETANIHPYAKLAWQIVSAGYKLVKAQIVRDQKVLDLVATMEKVYVFVDAIETDLPAKSKVLENTIKKIFMQTIECAIFVREYSIHGFGARTLRGPLLDAETIDRLSKGLLDLKRDFDSGLTAQNVVVSFRIHECASTLLMKQTLLELKPAEMHASDRTECLPATRHDVLSLISDWATSPSGTKNIFWLYGLAGSGKSTISTTIASYFRDLGRLGAFVFFDRSFPEQSHPSGVIRTLAYKLGLFDHRIGAAISAAIESFPSIIDASLHIQFIKLLVEPLSSLTALHTEGPIVIVLDALDECGNVAERMRLLTLLGAELSCLPPMIRVLITSREMDDIVGAFASRPNISTHALDVSSDANDRDIVTYFQHRLGIIRAKTKRLGADWPGNEVIHELVHRTCGLFVWASTALTFIDGYDPQQRLDIILKGQAESRGKSALDTLYATALEGVGMWADEDFVKDFRAIFGMILALRNPLTSTAIDRLLDTPEGRESIRLMSILACVLSYNPTVRVLHPSFADFLLSRPRCGRDIWYFNTNSCHRRLAIQCLQRLDTVLKRNISNLTLSANPEDKTLSEDVTYACIFWVDHVCAIAEDKKSIMEQLDIFLQKHLLHWFEVMSILKRSRNTITLLNNLHWWITTCTPIRKGLSELVSDACRFAQTFAQSIEEHPLLVYFAALPFSPTNSEIYKQFHNDRSFPSISGGFHQSWSPLLLVFAEHGGAVNSVAFSADGKRIVSGSGDKTIQVWDARSGAQVLPGLRGHEHWVRSVAFSPDGSRIVSGSYDETVRVWDAVSGAEILQLRGHKGPVCSVAFSLDGTRIVSGSYDKTVRVWDAVAGVEILPRLQGHDHWVQSVAFSPDGTRIVSGSDDQTIRVWDAVSGTEFLSALQGHKGTVRSVAFSPDGTQIVSGSYDETVRIWDAFSGAEVLPALRGHNEPVCSVTFSPNGRQIVSGSHDKSVRVWDAKSGVEVLPALRGHENWVQTVAFSPDGKRIVSGSDDQTARVWDVVSGAEVRPALQWHEHWVWSVAFSPDGSRIASGSADHTVRVWDALSGTEVLPTLRGHEGTVRSVAFSPDGTRIVSGSYDETVRVWDAVSGTEVLPVLRGHGGPVYSVTFTPDGRHIISGSPKNTLLSRQRPPEYFHMVRSAALSLDEVQFVRGSDDNNLRIWDATTGFQLPSTMARSDHISNAYDQLCIIDVASEGRLVHLPTKRTISKLPAMIDTQCSTSYGRSLAVGTKGGRIFIMHFPPNVFTSLETRPIVDKGN